VIAYHVLTQQFYLYPFRFLDGTESTKKENEKREESKSASSIENAEAE